MSLQTLRQRYESKMAAAATKRKLGTGVENVENTSKKRDVADRKCTESLTNSENSGGEIKRGYNASYCERRGDWISLYDWNTGYYYFQNATSSQTQWEKPPEWDSVWSNYTSGSETSNCSLVGEKEEKSYKQTAGDIEQKVNLFSKRPARRQIDPEEKKKLNWIPEGATEYNIWYDRWVGEHWKGDRDFGPAETRCCLCKDAGSTKATQYDPSGMKQYFCIYFARGCCHLGAECGYIHNIPLDKDEKRIGLGHDVFGRDRHRTHKENMGGVGTFDKDCTTLYVGGLGRHKNLEELLWTEFGEWGEIEDIRIIPKLHIAFVRYKNRVNAEFAKVAMSDQQLDDCEMLNVRWAYDDPNPKARKEELLKAKQKLLQSLDERGFSQEVASQPRKLSSAEPAGVVGKYPNTDSQYPSCGVAVPSYDLADYTSQERTANLGPMTKAEIEQAQTLKRLNDAFKRVESSEETLSDPASSQPHPVERETRGDAWSDAGASCADLGYSAADYYQYYQLAAAGHAHYGAWGVDNAGHQSQSATHATEQATEVYRDPYRAGLQLNSVSAGGEAGKSEGSHS